MFDENTFGAPWGKSLKLATGLTFAIVAAIFIAGASFDPGGVVLWEIGMLWIPASLLGVSFLFSIRSYRVIESKLSIQRMGWRSMIDLSALESVEVDPSAMNKSIRLFGNGGLFCFAGLFRNNKLGRYRAFATSPKNAVILRFPNRTIVVTPDEPERFAELLRERQSLS